MFGHVLIPHNFTPHVDIETSASTLKLSILRFNVARPISTRFKLFFFQIFLIIKKNVFMCAQYDLVPCVYTVIFQHRCLSVCV